jgi:hypothetical protein
MRGGNKCAILVSALLTAKMNAAFFCGVVIKHRIALYVAPTHPSFNDE